jgi:hypothetical protein
VASAKKIMSLGNIEVKALNIHKALCKISVGAKMERSTRGALQFSVKLNAFYLLNKRTDLVETVRTHFGNTVHFIRKSRRKNISETQV